MIETMAKQQGRRPTRDASGLQQIASELSLSVSLVSKVLNGRLGTSRVSESTMKAIQQRAAETGYTKNLAAAALVTGRQNCIGVFVHPLGVEGSGLSDAIVQAIARRASEAGQRLLLNFFKAGDEIDRQRQNIHPSIMDGAIIAGVMHPELSASVIEIEKNGTPIVTMFDEAIDPSITNVGSNQIEVGRLATAHLIEQGCRRIAHISVMVPRRQGYEAALVAAGQPVVPELIFESVNFEYESGVAAVASLMERNVSFDGIVTQSDQQAAGAVHALLRAGRRVPEDVKIIGVDDSALCAYGIVPISSISQEFAHCGERSVEMLLAKVRGEVCPSETIKPVLRVRQSTAR